MEINSNLFSRFLFYLPFFKSTFYADSVDEQNHALKIHEKRTSWNFLKCTFRRTPVKKTCSAQMSHEKSPGWLGYIGDYTTQLYRALFPKPL